MTGTMANVTCGLVLVDLDGYSKEASSWTSSWNSC